MKVKMVAKTHYINWLEKGEIVEVATEVGNRWIRNGIATEAKAEAPKKPKEEATKAEKDDKKGGE